LPDIECGFATATQLLLHGPTIWVNIRPFPGQPGTATTQRVPALIDTGASASCIDDALARQLQLTVIDQAYLSGSAGRHLVNVYLAQIDLPAPLNETHSGRFTGVHLQAGGQNHRALLGRTLLKYFSLIYDGRTGSVKLKR